MSFNDENSNDWAAYKIYVIEEIKDLKESLEKVKVKVEDIRGDSIDSQFGNLFILFTYPRKNLYWLGATLLLSRLPNLK